MQKKNHNIRKIVVIIFILMFLLATYINARGSYLEYKELGENYLSIFFTNEKYFYSIMGINFVVLFLITYFTNRSIKKGLKVFFDEEKKEMPKLPNKSIALIISLVVSIVMANIFTPKVILFASNASFGETDYIFNLDISFYMFVEPLLKLILAYLLVIILSMIAYSAIYYVVVFNKCFDGIERETLKNSKLIKNSIRLIRFAAIIVAVYILVTTLDVVFNNFLTLDSGTELIGAGYTDVRIKIWGNVIFAILIIFTIFKLTSDFKKMKKSKIIKDILIVPIYLVAMFVIMFGFDLIFVNPNEYDKERAYIETNISSTQKAYGIDCEDETIEYSGTLTVEDVEENENIINNTAFVNQNIVLQNLQETKTGTGYYTYTNVSLANYDIGGKSTLVYVSPREILSSKRTYNSKTYEYTHGYGLMFLSATSVDEDGNIEYIKDDIDIETPQIYYGMQTDSIVVTQSNQNIEYDYTDSKGNDYTTSYEGDSGLSLNWFDRLILGIKKGNLKLAFSGNVSSNSKILINRNIIQRAKKALPNVVYDKNPYTVIDENGSIYWVLDAYTISDKYPYSTYTNIEYNNGTAKINYIRNSIKVIINAYDGSMKFYITDRTDPIAMAYRNIYPDLFEDLDTTIPTSISDKFVYPEFLYNVQATIMEQYHNTKSDVLYRGDNVWSKATYSSSTQTTKSTSNNTLDAYYTMVKDGETEQIGLIQMFSQSNKQNLVSYLVGTVNNGSNKLKLYKMSSDTGILGPTQLDNQIAQDESIQKEIESLNVTGAKVTKYMTIVPINNTLLYVESIYQTMINETDIPVLKKIIVASGNKVAIGDNLTDALENLVSQYAKNIETYTTEDIDGLIQSIIKSNKNLSSSMDSQDWELIGTDIKKLQELISSLEEQLQEENLTNGDGDF